MTEEQLTAIEARATAATVGPWATHDQGRDDYSICQDHGNSTCQPLFERIGPVDNGIDGTFIAAARADVPALVAEVRRLRTLVERAFQEGQDGRILDGHDQFVYDVEWKDSDAFKALDDS